MDAYAHGTLTGAFAALAATKMQILRVLKEELAPLHAREAEATMALHLAGGHTACKPTHPLRIAADNARNEAREHERKIALVERMDVPSFAEIERRAKGAPRLSSDAVCAENAS